MNICYAVLQSLNETTPTKRSDVILFLASFSVSPAVNNVRSFFIIIIFLSAFFLLGNNLHRHDFYISSTYLSLPIHLCLHHWPVNITFALYSDMNSVAIKVSIFA